MHDRASLHLFYTCGILRQQITPMKRMRRRRGAYAILFSRTALSPTHTHIETCKFPSSASVITWKVIIVIDTDCLQTALRADHCYSLRLPRRLLALPKAAEVVAEEVTTWFAAPRRPLAASAEFIGGTAACLLSAATS